jgi:hypothetical protein
MDDFQLLRSFGESQGGIPKSLRSALGRPGQGIDVI